LGKPADPSRNLCTRRLRWRVALSALVFAQRLWKLASSDVKHCEAASRNKANFAVATLCRLF
jgi:hypothetical protein